MRQTLSSHPVSPGGARRRALQAGVTAACAAMLLTAIPSAASAAPQAADAAPTDGLIADYSFDQTSGTTIANGVAGGGDATVVNGTDAQWTGDSLTFTGGAKTSTSANWVRLPQNLLAGENSATITVEAKIDPSMKSTYNFLWNIGSDSTQQYWFASVRDAPRSAITTGGGNREANARSASSLDANRWYSLTSVIDGDADTISFYIDGVLAGRGATTLNPASITAQTINAIGRSPYPDPFFKGEVSSFRVYDRALSADEVADVADIDGEQHAAEHLQTAQALLAGVADITVDDVALQLPDYAGVVTWSSDDPRLVIGDDGVTLTASQPAPGQDAVSAELTAVVNVRGQSVTGRIPVTIEPAAGIDTPYGYVLVHFIEDSQGYAEKIYLDVSRGDNPEQWDPLNGGKPILASDLGTTGIRDPYLTYSPETETYYIIATDLRVFGGNRGVSGCTEWCYWSSQGSMKLNVWESKDLVTWGEQRQFSVDTDAAGTELFEGGMAWAPEATWVPDYYGEGDGAFVLYWSTNVYTDAAHTSPSYNRVLWGASKDFTQETYEYGGDFVNAGANTIDTTLIQNDGKTYRITKDNGLGKGIYMEVTTAERWWEADTAWTIIQTRLGAEWAGGNAGGVEGPAVFKRHDDDFWYLYTDVIPSTGYRPLFTENLDEGWTLLQDGDFSMAPHTKHGGVVSITKGQYDTIREADATSVVEADLGSASVASGASADEVAAALPQTAQVNLAYGRGTSELPVDWSLDGVDTSVAGDVTVTGTVRSIGANLNTWTGANGSTAWDAADKVLSSTTALHVTATLTVGESAAQPAVTITATTRCVAGKTVLVTTVTNAGSDSAAAAVATPYGSKSVSLPAGRSASQAFSTRAASIDGGTVSVTADDVTASAQYQAAACG